MTQPKPSRRQVLVNTADFKKYFPSVNQKLSYTSFDSKLYTKEQTKKELKVKTASGETFSGVSVNRAIDLVHVTQNPLDDTTLKRLEAAVRRNWAVRSGLSVREYFTFGYGSTVTIELAEEETIGLKEEEKQKKIDELTKKHIEIIKECIRRDNKVKLMQKLRVGTWQAWIFGRGLIVKLFNDEVTESQEVKRLQPVNSRRLGMPILNEQNDLSFEGVIVDGQGLDKDSMIYMPYMPYNITPHTDWYGYPPLETVQHIAEELNIATEEDVKEILKSAWLASILFKINTAGLTLAQAKTKINGLISNIKAGKYIGVNEDVIETTVIDLKPNYDGIIKMIDSLETKIYKALHVPQFLVQSESIANRATALQSATLFINGVITYDQQWLEDILQSQWYDPYLKTKFKGKLPEFKIRRVFNQPKVADFVDLAESIQRLISMNVWDIEKANQELGTEEVTTRVIAEKEANQERMDLQMQMQPKPEQKDSTMEQIEKGNRPPVETATASLQLRTGYLQKKDKLLAIILKRIEHKNSK